jgi:hypothetical protein
MNSIQEIVIDKIKALTTNQQERVLLFVDWLLTPNEVSSEAQLEECLLSGIESLDQGQGIVATDEWWEQERDRLISNSPELVSQPS